MDLAAALFGPGLVGGLLVGLWLWVVHRRRTAGQVAPHPEGGVLLDPINAARIRVAGVGGLGLVAMALVVAAFVPAIRISLAIAAPAGVVLGGALILWRRRSGPLPSSGQRPGAATIFALQGPEPPAGADATEPSRDVTGRAPRWRLA